MDGLAVPQHGHSVSNRPQLIEPVSDIDHAHPLRLQRLHDPKNFNRFRLRQRRCRLVEDQQAGTMLHGPADLHKLLLCRAEILHDPVRLQRKFVSLNDAGGLALHAAAVHPAERAARLPAEENILRNGQVLRKQAFLMHHRDAMRVTPRPATEE